MSMSQEDEADADDDVVVVLAEGRTGQAPGTRSRSHEAD